MNTIDLLVVTYVVSVFSLLYYLIKYLKETENSRKYKRTHIIRFTESGDRKDFDLNIWKIENFIKTETCFRKKK